MKSLKTPAGVVKCGDIVLTGSGTRVNSKVRAKSYLVLALKEDFIYLLFNDDWANTLSEEGPTN